LLLGGHVINPKLHRYVGQLTTEQDYLLREFVEDYKEGAMSRRDLVERAFRMMGSTAAAAALLLALGVQPAHADPLASVEGGPRPQTPPQSPFTVPEGDPSIITADVTFPTTDGTTMMAYLARPRAAGRFPAVMICHENTGTGEHYRDVTRRFAKNGYVGLHLDLLSHQGGTANVPDNQRSAALSAPGMAEQFVADFQRAMAYLRQQPFVIPDRIGMTGFCFGGGVTYNMIAAEPTLRAAAPFYGFISGGGDPLRNARAATLVIFGANDQLTNNIPAIEAALQAARAPFRTVVYPNAAHAFFNDTRPTYVESAATAAWRDTLAWFATYLRGGALPATGDGSTAEDDSQDEATESE
jgi:carboxymethylenebutenolidase